MGDSFRDAAWDNQLDNMLDDLQSSVSSRGETHGYKNGYHNGTNGHTSREYQERQNGNSREVREKVTHTAGGPGQGYSYREESQFVSSSSTSGGPMMGSKKAIGAGANMEQHIIDEKKSEYDGGMRGRSDSLVSDLTSIAKIRSVSKSSTSHTSSSQRYEYSSSSQQQENGTPTPTSNTQQSIKKNINDLDNLLSNLSSHNTSATTAGLSRASSKPASREGSPSRRGYPGYSSSHVSRSEERRERLMSNASQYRSPSLSRPPSRPASRPPSRPHSPALNGHGGLPSQAEFSSQQMTMTSTMRSNVSGASSMGAQGDLFRPVHTTPDPLTGRYADGRITPNHGYTRNFVNGTSPMPVRKVTQTESNNGIPRKADELLSSLGHQVDSREFQRITQEETTVQHQKEKEQRKLNAMGDENFIPTKNVAGPPVFYPQGDLFTKNKEDVKAREAELSAQGQYFSASYAAERGARSKEESGEKGGAAVIPICLPLCCAAPCVIM